MGELVLRTLVLVALVGGCTKHVNQCTSDSDCTDPAYPFCDLNGEFPASGGMKDVCTVTPANCPVDRCGCTPGAVTCSADQLLTCNPDGKSQTMTACALGCATEGTRCLTFEPSNGLGPALAAAAGEADVVLPKGIHVDTDTGAITDAAGLAISVDSLVVTQGSSAIRAFLAKSFVLDDATVTGRNAFALVASGGITLTGRVSAGAHGTMDGPGGLDSGACVGTDTQIQPAGCTTSCNAAGAGAGNATSGGAGGIASGSGPAGGASLVAFTPLVGGCRGGSLKDSNGASVTQLGGGAGGAVQLVSLSTISFTGNGMIDVSGGGGNTSAGGGSGGLVILEGPVVELSGSNTGITTNGGAGGGCQMSGPDGRPDATAALGPQCAPYSAGDGGTSTSAPTGGSTCTGTCFDSFFGGGGGAVGRIEIATRDANYANAGALLSGAVTTSTLTAN